MSTLLLFIGCVVDVTQRNGFIVPPAFQNKNQYPPSVTCRYVIRAPDVASRGFQLMFPNFYLSDSNDYVKVTLYKKLYGP